MDGTMPFARNDGTEIYYEARGDGEPVLLVPGLGGSTRQLAGLAEALARDCRVVSVDPRGAGLSGKPDEPYAASTLADDMIAVLDAAGLSDAHLVGISFGGMIGQALALRHPARLRSLVLASSYATSDAWTERMWALREMLLDRLGLAEHVRLAAMFLFSRRIFRAAPESVAAFEAAVAANPPDPAGYRRQLTFCRSHDLRLALRAVAVPTLVVTGAEDMLASPLQGRELAACIPGARYHEVPEAAHLFMLARPAEFAATVRAFHAGLPRAPAPTR
jgi:aminoacrylate hydrolase